MKRKPSHWPTFKELSSRLQLSTAVREAESVLREAKAQLQSGVIKRRQLEDLRDMMHRRFPR